MMLEHRSEQVQPTALLSERKVNLLPHCNYSIYRHHNFWFLWKC